MDKYHARHRICGKDFIIEHTGAVFVPPAFCPQCGQPVGDAFDAFAPVSGEWIPAPVPHPTDPPADQPFDLDAALGLADPALQQQPSGFLTEDQFFEQLINDSDDPAPADLSNEGEAILITRGALRLAIVYQLDVGALPNMGPHRVITPDDLAHHFQIDLQG